MVGQAHGADGLPVFGMWWSYTWRSIGLAMVLGAVLGGLGGVVVGLMGRADLGFSVGRLLGMAGSLPASFIAFRSVVRRRL